MVSDARLPGGGPWTGGDAVRGPSAAIHGVVAGNAGPMTLDGTNTWILSAPDGASGPGVTVIDPGPDHTGHLGHVLSAAATATGPVVRILLTHGHDDHSGGAPRMAERTGAPVLAADPDHATAGVVLAGGAVVDAGGCEIQVLATPGHTRDSVCFLVPSLGVLFTGDTVLGRGSSVVAHPDGRLGEYLRSLEILRDVAATRGVTTLLPGHGPPIREPLDAIEGYLAHRQSRLRAVREALAAGARSPRDVVATVYGDVDPQLEAAAVRSVEAQLAYLEECGVTVDDQSASH